MQLAEYMKESNFDKKHLFEAMGHLALGDSIELYGIQRRPPKQMVLLWQSQRASKGRPWFLRRESFLGRV